MNTNKTSNIILTIFILVFRVMTTAAQIPALTPLEGATHSYTWEGLQENAQYEFYVTADVAGRIIYDDKIINEIDVLNNSKGTVAAGNSAATVQIKWNDGAAHNTYFLWIKVTGKDECCNFRYVKVTPQPNRRFIAFDMLTSNSCYDPAGNGFKLPLSLLGNSSIPVSETYFPVRVKFTVNGSVYTQKVEYKSQKLQITEEMFTVNPFQDTEVVVGIVNTTDGYNESVFPGIENSLHVRTIFAIPVIEFTQ